MPIEEATADKSEMDACANLSGARVLRRVLLGNQDEGFSANPPIYIDFSARLVQPDREGSLCPQSYMGGCDSTADR